MKRLVPIYSILAVAIFLLAAFVPSCTTPTPTTGTIVVQATLCGNPWQGAVNYKLTLTGGTTINGTAVPTTHSSAAVGTWTCAYVSGGPAGAFLNSIKPSASQSLAAGGTITFTLDFELDQDAAIQWFAWSLNGEPQLQHPSEILAVPCQILDTHFNQWVKGCDGYNVTMDETSGLNIVYLAGPVPGPITIVAINDWCAVNKTPAPREKVSQVPSFYGEPTVKGHNITLALDGMPIGFLDVHTQWKLVKGVNYTKAINWLGISTQPMFETLGPHPCVLFELVLPPFPGAYTFQVQATAEVDLVGDTDVNPANNYTLSPQILLTVNVPP